MVTEADAKLFALAVLTARIVMVAGDGTTPGAEYTPTGEIVPTVTFPPSIPFTCHLTDMFAEKLRDEFTLIEAEGGVMVTTGSEMVTVAVPDFVGSALLTPRITTVCAVAGAV